MKSMGLRCLVLVFLCLAISPDIFTDQIPTAAEVGVPERFQKSVAGSVILRTGESRVLTLGRTIRDVDTGEPFKGSVTRLEKANFSIYGPAAVEHSGQDSALIRATGEGKGYIEGFRIFYYREGSSSEEKKAVQIVFWILVVKPEGQTADTPTSLHIPAKTTLPDIPRAVISGRAVMRGTGEGVSGAYIELIGDRVGTLQTGRETAADGSFSITLDGVLSVDRYEVFLRKPAGAGDKKALSFEGDLWPIHKYYVSINHDNAGHVNVGIIEMASVSSLWGGTGAYDRPVVVVTPKPAPPPAGGAGTPPGGGTQPSGYGQSPWLAEGAGAPRIFTASDPDAPPGDPAGEAGDATGPAANVPTTQVDYKGHAEVDFYLKATLMLKFQGRAVTGELYQPMVSGQNVRLPGHRMQLTGKLKGKWEDGGEISGTCEGHILWPGGQPEERAGFFGIRKVGKEIHFRSTNFYYNRYIFGARGIKFDPPDDVDPAGVGQAPGAGLFANSIVILIDASGSMSGAKMTNAKATANRQIAGLGADTELAVIAFSGNAVKFPFEAMTPEAKTRAQQVVESIVARGGTPLAAGIRDAGGYMRKNARGRRLSLIILSDGEETAGGNPPEEVRRLNDMTVKW